MKRKEERTYLFHSYLHVFLCFLPSPFHLSYNPTCLLPPPSSPLSLCPRVFSALPPSLSSPLLSLHPSTSFLCPSLPVSPVYEGKFIGLPGAVSWRWPLLLEPQQGFTLHMEQKQHSGHTGLFPSPHITHDSALTPPIIC